MAVARIMHVDDEPDIRLVVRISLELDPDMTVRSCSSGVEALAAAREWRPDIMLLDVMMPGMDGPTTLANLRLDPSAASIPVVFMTARVQSRELDHFKSLGAVGVLAKPFEPRTLATSLRKFLPVAAPDLSSARAEFLAGAEDHARALERARAAFAAGGGRPECLIQMELIAHKLAGAGGIFGCGQISAAATALENLVLEGASDADIHAAAEMLLLDISVAAAHRVSPAGVDGILAHKPELALDGAL